MKQFLVMVAIGVFSACNSGSATDSKTDSLTHFVDSSQRAQKDEIDSTVSAQKDGLDSVRKDAKVLIDPAGRDQKDSIKGKL